MRKILFALGALALFAAGFALTDVAAQRTADAQMRTPTPNVPLNDFAGQLWSLKTQDDGSGNQEPVTAAATAATYSYASVVTPAASATDVWTICGSATKTVSVESITIAATATSASAQRIYLALRSTADTGGTSAAVTPAPNDSNNAAATEAVLAYSVNPSALGTLVSNVAVYPVEIPATGTPGAVQTWIFRLPPAQPIVLRGTAQCLAVNLNGSTTSGLILYITDEQIEQ